VEAEKLLHMTPCVWRVDEAHASPSLTVWPFEPLNLTGEVQAKRLTRAPHPEPPILARPAEHLELVPVEPHA
jgi:hypothetical protein